LHVAQALRTGASGLDSASDGECCNTRQCTIDLGAHPVAEGIKNSLPPAIAAARPAFVGAGSCAVTAASILPATTVGTGRQPDATIALLTSRVGEEEPKSACLQLAVPKGGAVCCDATVTVAPIARFTIEPSCVGMRFENAKVLSAKRIALSHMMLGS
jgi:hypothetical protein